MQMKIHCDVLQIFFNINDDFPIIYNGSIYPVILLHGFEFKRHIIMTGDIRKNVNTYDIWGCVQVKNVSNLCHYDIFIKSIFKQRNQIPHYALLQGHHWQDLN